MSKSNVLKVNQELALGTDRVLPVTHVTLLLEKKPLSLGWGKGPIINDVSNRGGEGGLPKDNLT